MKTTEDRMEIIVWPCCIILCLHVYDEITSIRINWSSAVVLEVLIVSRRPDIKWFQCKIKKKETVSSHIMKQPFHISSLFSWIIEMYNQSLFCLHRIFSLQLYKQFPSSQFRDLVLLTSLSADQHKCMLPYFLANIPAQQTTSPIPPHVSVHTTELCLSIWWMRKRYDTH